MFIVFLFVLLILSILLTIEPTNLKNSYSQISEKHEQNYIMCLTLKANIRIMLCPFTKYYRKNYNRATIDANELLSMPLSLQQQQQLWF